MNTRASSFNDNISISHFTGNWYIDAGILGFIKIMEGVYGWDLHKLNEMIAKNHIKVYYGYFPFAYILNVLKRSVNEENHKDIISELECQLEKKTFSGNEEEYKREIYRLALDFVVRLVKKFSRNWPFENIKDYEDKKKWLKTEIENKIKDIKEDIESKSNKEIENIIMDIENFIKREGTKGVGRIRDKIESIMSKVEKRIAKQLLCLLCLLEELDKLMRLRLPLNSVFYRNLLFFNPSHKFEKQVNSLFDLISSNIQNQTILSRIDKTINIFLYSEREFENIGYTMISTKSLAAKIRYLFVYLICFEYAFTNYKSIGRILFYSQDLHFCYEVNKKLEKMMKLVNEEDDINKIIRITWEKIIDTLFEKKSSWSLENMYIISYRDVDAKRQSLIDVEYIGIPRLQASLLLDDKIRMALNSRIKCREADAKWMILEFIKGHPLYPIVLDHVVLVVNGETSLKPRIFTTLLYSLILDAKLNEIRALDGEFKNEVFTDEYFNNYKWLVEDVKREIRYVSFSASILNETSEDNNKKKELARNLITSLKDKNMFLNNLLRELNNNKSVCNNEELRRLIFNKLILNNINWKNYGLILVLNLLR